MNDKNISKGLIVLATILVGFVIANPTFAKEPEMVEYDFPITRVIDGDTVAFEADFLPDPLKQELSIRVYGVDTPEKSWRAECDKEAQWGAEASAFTKNMINESRNIKIAIYKWDKYGGRVLGDVILDGFSLRALLLENGYAREYFGDKKESWCDEG
jgi:endonuclease YncB( thermonuclease family)